MNPALLKLLDRAAPVLTLVAVLLLWEIGCRAFSVPAFVLPAPSVVVSSVPSLEFSTWSGHILATLQVSLIGYLVSILLAVPLAIGITSSRFLARTVLPWLIVIQSTPIVAIAPIIVVTLGAGAVPRIVITTLISFFPIVIYTASGLASVPAELIELSRSLRASRSREYWQIRIPYAIPHIFSALKVAITLAVIGAVVAEFVAAEKGLGYLILFSTSSFKIPVAFAALAILVCCSLLLYAAIVWLQQRCFPWSVSKSAD